jgi:SAM-dependent methyltransferase
MPAWLRRTSAYAALSWLRQMAFDRNFRETARLRAFPPPGLMQPSGHTRPDRHPELFAMARQWIGDGPGHHLMSFGCARGDEVFALREHFAAAHITGIDISARRIRECRARARKAGAHHALHFVVAASAESMAPASFDAVFAMSVLRHGDLSAAPARCDHRMVFADFERVTATLARSVKPGGLLVVRHACFRFGDTASAANFDPLIRRPRDPRAPLYDRDHRLMPDEDEETVMFRKHG